MCLFCAAIPMTASVGTAITAKHKEKRHVALAQGEPMPRIVFPVGKIVVLIVVGLIVSSAFYHMVILPRIGG